MLFALTDNLEIKQFRAHKYWRQVNLDVDRSHRRFPAGGAIMLIFPVGSHWLLLVATSVLVMSIILCVYERPYKTVCNTTFL